MDRAYLHRFLNDSSKGRKRNEIRELLKLLAKPEIISLAGGLPSPETFPIAELADHGDFTFPDPEAPWRFESLEHAVERFGDEEFGLGT